MIEVKNLTFSYGKDKQALHGLNFTVGDGEIFGFLGPKDSGKSTTQKILTGILRGHGGMVSLFGKDLMTVHTQDFFQQIGVLFEFPYLYTNLSALDNLHYFSSFYPSEQLRNAEELLDELEFKRDFRKKPVSSYSKGMRQRVSMARALISNPKLWFLDEPTSGLDPTGAVLFRKLIEKERQKGTTVFVTTHNILDADLLCNRVAFIAGGNIVALDTPKNLKKQNSNRSIVFDYLYQGRREEQTILSQELKSGIPFAYDELISVHSQEPTLEDIFIQYTGRGVVLMWKKFSHLLKKDFKLMLSSKFVILALASLVLYSCYINFVYVNLDQEIYPVYLYDPQAKQTTMSDYMTRVDTRNALESACADRYSVGIDLASEQPEFYMLASGIDTMDHYRTIWAKAVLSGNIKGQAEMIGTNNRKMKNRREITAEFLFFELSAVGFLGLASMLFKEKQMGVIRVHGILPVNKAVFILSKLLVFLLSDLVFTVFLTVLNLGLRHGIAVLPAVLIQAGILSLIMALTGFFFAIRLTCIICLQQ